MFNFLYLWADIVWLPIAYFVVRKKHRWWAIGFIIASMIMVRLLTEIMVSIGYDTGIMGIMSSNVHTRALVVSGVFYILFFVMAYFSSETRGIVFMAASLSFFFAIFVTFSLVMLL